MESVHEEDFSGVTDDSEDSQAASADDTTWIQWFCGLRGNEFFCEVDEAFIADEFNLAGLSSQVPYYDYALSMMLDADSNQDVLTAEQNEYVESAAELLYGLVHQRFILTSKGLTQMLEKYRSCDFGRCPRVGCNGQPCLPVGTSDLPRVSTVKVFCPKCEDIYYPRSYYQGNLDGAFFGTTFPHLLLLTYPSYRPPKSSPDYVPRIFGFRVHPTAYGEDPQRNTLLQLEASQANAVQEE
jgi:casein kinase II subunit beta